MKKGEKYIIQEPILGRIVVQISDVTGNIIHYENKLLSFGGACHIDHFKTLLTR